MSFDDDFPGLIAPAEIRTTAQWAGWYWAAQLRSPNLTGADLGLFAEITSEVTGLSGPRWSVLDLQLVSQDQVVGFRNIVEAAVRNRLQTSDLVVLGLGDSDGDDLTALLDRANIDLAMFRTIAWPWTMSATPTQILMRPYRRPDPGLEEIGMRSTLLDDQLPQTVRWTAPEEAGE